MSTPKIIHFVTFFKIELHPDYEMNIQENSEFTNLLKTQL